jgi:hypothetical protein
MSPDLTASIASLVISTKGSAAAEVSDHDDDISGRVMRRLEICTVSDARRIFTACSSVRLRSNHVHFYTGEREKMNETRQ